MIADDIVTLMITFSFIVLTMVILTTGFRFYVNGMPLSTLRLRSSGRRPQMDQIEKTSYHLFLSHVAERLSIPLLWLCLRPPEALAAAAHPGPGDRVLPPLDLVGCAGHGRAHQATAAAVAARMQGVSRVRGRGSDARPSHLFFRTPNARLLC